MLPIRNTMRITRELPDDAVRRFGLTLLADCGSGAGARRQPGMRARVHRCGRQSRSRRREVSDAYREFRKHIALALAGEVQHSGWHPARLLETYGIRRTAVARAVRARTGSRPGVSVISIFDRGGESGGTRWS